MTEMFDAIDAHRAAAKETQQEEEARRAAAFEEWLQQEALRKKAAIRRADLRFALRVVLFVLLAWGLCAAANAGLMAHVLAGGLLFLGFGCLGFWAGAWWQFRFQKGGHLHG